MKMNNFEKIYDDGIIKGYEKEIVAEGICESFIPASFIREEDRVKVIYNYDGYVSLSSLSLSNLEILELIESIIDKIEAASDMLVDFDRLSFNMDSIFYDCETKDVRMAFLWGYNHFSFNERLAILFNDMKAISSEDSAYLDRLSRIVLKENISLPSISERIRKLKSELRKIG